MTLEVNVTNNATVTVNSTGTLNLGTNVLSGTGAFTLDSGGTLGIGSTGGIASSGSTGNIQVSGSRTFSAGANYNYNGTSAQITGTGLPATVNNLTSNNSTSVTLTASVSVSANLSVSAGTLDLSTYTADRASAGGTLTVANGATLKIGGTGTLPANYSTHVIGATGTVEYAGSTTTVASLNSGQDYGNLTISGSGVTTSNSFGVATALTVSNGGSLISYGTVTMRNGSSISNSGTLQFLVLAIADSATVTTSSSFDVTASLSVGSGANFSPSSGTITMYGGSLANSGTLAFQNFAVAANQTVTGSGDFSVAGTFTVNTGAMFSPSAARIISGSGTLTGSGTVKVSRTAATADFSSQYTISNKTLTNLTVSYEGASAQVISALTYGGLSVNNAAGVTLAGDTTVNGLMNLYFGTITTSAYRLIISSTGSVNRTLGRVVGNFQKYVATGATSKTFEIGDATRYTPVAVSFGNVTVAGNLTAKSTAGDHANIGSSGINSAKSVNRYWTLTNNGIAFTDYNATFTFVAGDIDGGANTDNFIVGKYDVGTWTYPTVGTKAATSTQITGVTSFSDFQIGEYLQYTLTYTAGANGTITGTTPQTVNHGASGTAVTAVPNTGYHFVNWSDASTANPRTDTNVTGDISVTANFAINTYTLTYTAGANGTITGTSPQTVNHGASGTAVTAVPSTGYHFVNWSDASTANPRTDTNVTGDISVTANFAINSYTLTYTAGIERDDHGNESPDGQLRRLGHGRYRGPQHRLPLRELERRLDG